MKIALIGHRGVGKTHLMQRLAEYFSNYKFFDLDQEIEKKSSIEQIFKTRGEDLFRKTELQTLSLIDSIHSDYVISLGAGFKLDLLPQNIFTVWVRRSTDKNGRIFIDRPRLNAQVSPLEEWRERFSLREDLYSRKADFTYDMPEGVLSSNETERQIFARIFEKSPIKSPRTLTLTLRSSMILKINRILPVLLNLGVNLFELRDDLLSDEEIQFFLKKIPLKNILFSRRAPKKSLFFLGVDLHKIKIDFDQQFIDEIPADLKSQVIVSTHQLSGSLKQTLQTLEGLDVGSLKVAVKINSFKDLKAGLLWQSVDPARRNFLPMSDSGIWTWVRQLLISKQSLNFIRLAQGSASDQPTLYEALSPQHSHFAAVLGAPVLHSQTPLEQESFFKPHPVYRIHIEEAEWSEAFSVLTELGLVAAAVTSPLKILAFNSVNESKTQINSINTLARTKNKWVGTNTDIDGLKRLLAPYRDQKTYFVWGGGGTLDPIKSLLPEAFYFSVRTLKTRDQKPAPETCDVLIWAAGYNSALPPQTWCPKLIIDLNYREDSLAREYAVLCKAQYISGLDMFREQAALQRAFWKNYLEEWK